MERWMEEGQGLKQHSLGKSWAKASIRKKNEDETKINVQGNKSMCLS